MSVWIDLKFMSVPIIGPNLNYSASVCYPAPVGSSQTRISNESLKGGSSPLQRRLHSKREAPTVPREGIVSMPPPGSPRMKDKFGSDSDVSSTTSEIEPKSHEFHVTFSM